jgi:hypothetical protein
MKELYSFFGDSREKYIILEKSITIIFSEPDLKDDSKYQQKMIDELIDALKKKM